MLAAPPSFQLLDVNKVYPFAQHSLILEHVPEPNFRKYSHSITRRYLPATSTTKKKYVTEEEYDVLNWNDKMKTCVEKHEFTLHPLLRNEYLCSLSLTDIEQTIHSCSDRDTWLLMLLEGQPIRPCALKFHNSSFTDLIECGGKTIGFKKLLEIYEAKILYRIDSFRILPSRCCIANKDENHIGPMAVYEVSDAELIEIFSNVYNIQLTNDSLSSPATLNQISHLLHNSFISRVYPNFHIWKKYHTHKNVIPFEMVRKELCEGIKTNRGKKTAMLQIMCIIPEIEFNQEFGTPINLLEEPFRFCILSQLPSYLYNDFASLGFYITNSKLDEIWRRIQILQLGGECPL
jgi:hypothetical protein